MTGVQTCALPIYSVSRFILSRERALYPQLYKLTEGVISLEAIANHIDSLIDRFGQMRDSASDELYRIRRSIREREGQASKRLQQVLQAAKSAGIVEADATLSIRDGRAVIPVAAGNKRKLNGFVQGESATGKTFYLLPIRPAQSRSTCVYFPPQRGLQRGHHESRASHQPRQCPHSWPPARPAANASTPVPHAHESSDEYDTIHQTRYRAFAQSDQ